jgi:hypothetical protein
LGTKKYDLTVDFAHVPEELLTTTASKCWLADTADVDKHTMGTKLYPSYLLAKCLLAFISSELSLTIINKSRTTSHNDGTYILWAITNSIYRSNIAFMETIREKIVLATVDQCGHDQEKYLMTIKNNLQMITKSPTSKQHNGLITYIQCNIPLIHTRLTHLLPGRRSTKIDPTKTYSSGIKDKIRILKNVDAWTIPGTKETPTMALTASPVLTNQLKEFLANHITTELKRLASSTKLTEKDGIGKEGKH